MEQEARDRRSSALRQRVLWDDEAQRAGDTIRYAERVRLSMERVIESMRVEGAAGDV